MVYIMLLCYYNLAPGKDYFVYMGWSLAVW